MSGQLLMILAVTCFMVTHVSVKILQHIPFYEIVFFRALISLILCVYFLYQKKIPFLGNNKKILFLRGASGTLALILYFYTLHAMPLATAVTIQYLSPLLTILLSTFLLKESASPLQWLFFLLAFSGVMVIQGFDERVTLIPLAAGLVASLGSGFAYNFVRMLRHTDHELVIILYFPLITIPTTAPFVIANWVQPVAWDWLFLALVGVFTQVAQVFMTRALSRDSVANVSLYNYLGVIYAIVIGWFFFHEKLNKEAILGIGLIVASLIMSALVRWHRVRKLEGFG